MRDRFLSLPVWALFLILGAAWCAVFFVVNLISGDELLPALELAAVGGAVLGLATSTTVKLSWRTQQRVLGDVQQTDRSAAIRASRSGPVPTDPEVRSAALELAQGDLRRQLRLRPWMAAVLVLLVISEIGIAFTSSPWSLLVLAPLVPIMVFQLFVFPQRLQERIALLSR
ncbi:hypothetical protein [Kribbella sp. NPDC006257]|uniref:hypothetical protein n=1 Tax=Kribbella sp. NPDC006257 TaxID=3156738 RepID=UPI0033AECE1A